MSDIDKKIKKLEELIKGLKSNIQSNSVLPSIKQSKLEGVKAPSSGSTKLPGMSPGNKKSPIKQAEQIQNKDIKDMKMREAREALNVNKSTGQWSIEKKAPKGVDSDKHERCVMDVKDKGHNVGSARAICTSAMKKEEKPIDTYHIHQGSARITSKPLTIKEIDEKHGGVKKLEGAGYRLHQVKDNK